MRIDEDKIFVLTNPLFYIWAIMLLIYIALEKLLDITGIYDWYYVLFRFNRMSERGKEEMVFIMDKRAIRLFWLKRKAWEYATKLIKKENDL